MTVEDVRALLDITGPLYTRNPEDVGHISDCWRKTILSFCDLLDDAPLDVADRLRKAQEKIARLGADIERLENTVEYLVGVNTADRAETERAKSRATASVQLIEEAVPRMRSLNNQMSHGWLARADEFLGGN